MERDAKGRSKGDKTYRVSFLGHTREVQECIISKVPRAVEIRRVMIMTLMRHPSSGVFWAGVALA